MRAKIRDTEIFFDVMGESIAVTEQGMHEKPAIFLLHGGPGGDHTVFKKYCAELQHDAQLIMMDHRGCGRSKKGAQANYTLENNVEDMEALRIYLGLEKIIVYGHSYGGVVAQAYTLRYPQHVTKLILGVTMANARFYTTAREKIRERGGAKEIAWAEKLLTGSFASDTELKQFFIEMMPMYSNKALKQNMDGAAFKNMLVSHEAINEGFGGFLQTINFIPDLHKIDCPTLVFAGKDDWICASELSEEIAAEIPHAKLVIFEHSGHSVPIDEHEAYIHMMRDFIREDIL